MRDDILIGDTPKAKRRKQRLAALTPRGRLWKHATLADIDGVLSADEIAQLFCFTLVRNPWDRMVSYYHWLREQGFDHPSVALARAVPFGDFLRHENTRRSLRNWPAERYMQDANGCARADLYIRLEHFRQDAAPLEKHLGFTIELPHQNASGRRTDYRSYYDDGLAEVVATDCRADIVRFGYAFDPPK